MGMKRVPQTLVVPGIVSPMVFSLGRTLVVLPACVVQGLSAPQRRAIVMHELAHLRRGDHWVRWFEVAGTCALWWHPLLWLARWGLHEAEEQCCDAWVVTALPAEGRRDYADALVDVLEMTCGMPLPVGASGLGRMKHLTRRLTMILDRTPDKSMSLTGKMAVLLLAALLPLAPVRGDAPGKAAQTTPASAAVDDSTRKAIESLLETAQDHNEQVRQAAMNAVVRFGPRAVPVLIDALGNEKAAPLAQSLLSQLGIGAIEGLIEAIDSSAAPAVRERAMMTVEMVLAPNANPVLGMEGSGEAAGGFGTGLPGVASGFNGRVNVPMAPNMVSYASWAAAPAAKASTDASVSVRRAAVRLLGAISNLTFDPAVAKALAAAMKDQDVSVRRSAAGAMVNVARLSPQVSSALAAGASDADQSVRISALMAMGALGPAGKEAMPVLTAALKDSNPAVRIAAADALGALQTPPPPAPGTVAANGNILTPNGFMPSAGGGDAELAITAQNIWHWVQIKRYDLAKRDADQLLQSQPRSPGALLLAFCAVSQERGVDFTTWLNHLKDVKELKDLTAQLVAENNPQGFFSAEDGAAPTTAPH
jgi:HEAT repeat protein